MDSKIAAKIERHKTELEGSSLHPETKENLSAFIDKVAFASNGCPDKLAALVELVGDLCFMKIEDRVRQPAERKAELAKALQEFSDSHDLVCPVRRLTQHVDGKPVYPWDSVKPPTGLSAFSISFREGLKANGPVAVIFAVVVAVMLTMYGINKWQTSKFRDMIDAKLDEAISEIGSASEAAYTN